MTDFVHLHNHTHYSLLDGLCRIGEMVDLAHKYKMPAVAITDHGNMFGAIQFYKKALNAGIKPIIGLETYVAPKSRFDKSGAGKGGAETSHHLVLLARNLDGYRNLMKLSSIAFLEGFYYRPRIDKEILASHAEGLVAMSSCIKGEIPYKIIQDDPEGARAAASFYKDLFGEHFYLELQNHGLEEEIKAIKGLTALSRSMDIPLVATNDTHYLKREHAEAHDVLLCVQTGKDLDDPRRLKFSSDEIYFKSPEEMASVFSEFPDALKNTIEIAEKCHLVLNFDTLHLPKYQIPPEEGVYSLDEYLEKKAWEGLVKRYPSVTPELENRLKYELGIIHKMGFAGYFLIVMDFICYAKSHDIPVGPGRGSAAGSLVSYALGITDIDPMRYHLLFERFLNPDRISMPDIDIDFCYEQRDHVIQYVNKKYGGEKNVTQIITFGRMNARAVVRDVGRVMNISYGEVDRIAKAIPFNTPLEKAYQTVSEFRDMVDANPVYTKLLEHAKVLEGLTRHASTHAAGVVIAPEELTNSVPLYKQSQGDITTQYDMKSLKSVGLLKMDFLGLRTLTVIDHTIKNLKKRNIDINITHLPLDDEKTFSIFARGETIGIFQFESSGMREYLRQLKPTCIEDLIAMNALYRPGPMENIPDFIDRKHGKTKITYLHPRLEPILEETYGIIVYQEQVMQIASEMGGFTLGEADLLRSAMSKKDMTLMQELRSKFLSGAEEKSVDAQIAQQVFDLMDKFAGYGFNKSHAASYSIIAYQTAFLKAHYPDEFMAANLTSEMNNTDRIVILSEECRRMGIEVMHPDINKGFVEFVPADGGIYFGLGAIKNVGKSAIESILAARTKCGIFKTLFDLGESVNLRQVNKKVFESLIQCGAMDSLEGTRAQKMAILPKTLQVAQSAQASVNADQTSIFSDETVETRLFPELPDVPPWSQAERLKREKELLGFYVSGHPLMKYKDEVEAFARPKTAGLNDISTGQQVRLCGIITEVSTRQDRKNNTMAFFHLEDFSGSVRILAFSDMYEKYQNLIQQENMVVVTGKMDRRGEGDSGTVILCEMIPLEQARQLYTQGIFVRIDQKLQNDENIDRAKRLFQHSPGECSVYMNLVTGEGDHYLLKSKRYKVRPTPKLVEDLRDVFGKDNVCIQG